MTKVDEHIKTSQDMLNGIVERCYELEEENQTLKDNVEFLHSCLDDRDKSIELMKEEKKFKVLKEGLGIDLHSLDETLWQQNLLITRLEEENKKLSEKNGQLKEESEELKIWLREKLPLALLKEYMEKFEGVDLENV